MTFSYSVFERGRMKKFLMILGLSSFAFASSPLTVDVQNFIASHESIEERAKEFVTLTALKQSLTSELPSHIQMALNQNEVTILANDETFKFDVASVIKKADGKIFQANGYLSHDSVTLVIDSSFHVPYPILYVKVYRAVDLVQENLNKKPLATYFFSGEELVR